MKKKLAKACALTLSAAMSVTGVPAVGLVSVKVSAAEKTDDSVIYFVDCGDQDTSTFPKDGAVGEKTRNSVTDQVYGADAKTGYKWGIVDTVSEPLKNGKPSVGGAVTDWTWPFEQITGDQTSKILTNRYTKNQTENNIDPRYLDYKFEVDNGSYLIEVGFADPWGCSKTPTVYANYEKKDETLLAKEFDVASNGGVLTGMAEVMDGELTVNARGTGSENLAINITYITIKSAGDSTMVQTDYDALSIRTQGVTSNLDLPSKGSAGSAITWSSSNETVISKDGVVTRPESGQADAKVTLTATITYGEASKTKEFVVTVSAINEMMGLAEFNKTMVEVTDTYYDEALELDAENLLKLDADRLLAGFRETAGYAAGMDADARKEFMKKKTRYGGNWENSLIGGHTLGHYISAVAQGVVNPGLSKERQAELKERMDYLVNALAECQDMTKNSTVCKEGYIFGATLTSPATNLEMQFDNVEKGMANISTQAWVPWYTMHKILAGLVDAYELTGSEKALTVAKKLGDWTANRVNGWSASVQRTTLGIEYGGMNDALYELYKCTGEENYKTAAHMFDETSLFETVLAGTKNAMNNKHANTTIPKFLGALGRYEADNSEIQYLEYAKAFWQMVIDNHTYVTGGNSEDEHFGADNILDAERTNINNETCNTYNMLKLSRRLFMITGEKKYADYYENTLINAIMSSQNHETGMTMYFQPMASGYHKVFGTLDTNFWCCTGSGMENFTKLQDSIYFKQNNTVIVNQYLASTLSGDGYVLEQTGDLSKSDTMNFKLSGEKTGISMKLRIPDWVADEKVTVTFGEKEYDYTKKDGYIIIPAEKLEGGASFSVKLPMEVVAYNLPDAENTYAFKYGPFVLSAKLGSSAQNTASHGVAVTVASQKAVTSDNIGIMAEATVEDFIVNINKYLIKDKDSMNFTLNGTDVSYTFTTHYNQYKESYGIYWTYFINEDGRGAEAVLADKRAKRLERVIIDTMAQAGRGQYESRFVLADGDKTDGLVDNGSIGEDAPALTRRAAAGGSFGYKMVVSEGEDNYLLLTFAKEEDGKPVKISVGDTVLFDGKLNSSTAKVDNLTLAEADTADYYQVMYQIPLDVVAKNVESLTVKENEQQVTKKVITVTFAGTETEESARICKSVSMLKALGTQNSLTKVTCDGEELRAEGDTYSITVPYTVVPEVKFEIEDSYGYITVDGNAIDETEARKLKKAAAGAEEIYEVKVYAEDFKTVKTYTIKVNKDYSGLDLKGNYVKGFSFDDAAGGAVAVSKAFLPPEVAGAEYTYQEGVVGKAITLNGTYGLKLLEDANILGESYTISFWMNPKAVGATFDPTITGGLFSPEYWLNLTLDGKIWSKANDTYIETKVSNAYKANEWQQVTITVDGQTSGKASVSVVGTLYVNGVQVSKGDVPRSIMMQPEAKLYFGVNAWDAYFSGALDDVLLFNKALTAEEISGIVSKAVTSETLGDSNEPGQTEEPKGVKVKAAGYTLAGNKLNLVKGNKVKLETSVAPAKADQKVTFASSKTSVATISAKGVITAKKAGSTKITVKTTNNKKKVLNVKVVKKAKVNKVLTLKKTKLSLKKDKTAAIKILKQSSGTTSTLVYKTGNKKVAVVDKYGVVTAKKKGNTTITVICGKKRVKVKVTVK